MAKAFAKKFYNSKRWQACRESYIGKRRLIDGGMCEHCRSRLGYIVDHIEELTEDNITNPEISLDHDNLQYLCLECHNKKTFGKGGLCCMFDEEGQPVER